MLSFIDLAMLTVFDLKTEKYRVPWTSGRSLVREAWQGPSKAPQSRGRVGSFAVYDSQNTIRDSLDRQRDETCAVALMPQKSSRGFDLVAQADLLRLPFLAPAVFRPFRSATTISNSSPRLQSAHGRFLDLKTSLPKLERCSSGRRYLHHATGDFAREAPRARARLTKQASIIHKDGTKTHANNLISHLRLRANDGSASPGHPTPEQWDSVSYAFVPLEEEDQRIRVRRQPSGPPLKRSNGAENQCNTPHTRRAMYERAREKYLLEEWSNLSIPVPELKESSIVILEDLGENRSNEYYDSLEKEWAAHQLEYSGKAWLKSAAISLRKSPALAMRFCHTVRPDPSVDNEDLGQFLSALTHSVAKDLPKSNDELSEFLTSLVESRGLIIKDSAFRYLIDNARGRSDSAIYFQRLYNATKHESSFDTEVSLGTKIKLANGLQTAETADACLGLLARIFKNVVDPLDDSLASTVLATSGSDDHLPTAIPDSDRRLDALCSILHNLFVKLPTNWAAFEQLLRQYSIELTPAAKQKISLRFARVGDAKQCLLLLESAIKEGYPADSSPVLKTCVQLLSRIDWGDGSFHGASSLLQNLVKAGVKPDVLLFNVIAQQTMKSGNETTAWRILEIIGSEKSSILPNDHSRTLLLRTARLLKNKGHLHTTRRVYQDIQLGTHPDWHPALIAELLRNVLTFGSWNGKGWGNVVAEYAKFYSVEPLVQLGMLDGQHIPQETSNRLPLPGVMIFRLMLRAWMHYARTHDRIWNVYRLFRGYAEEGHSPFVEYASYRYIYSDFIYKLMRAKSISGISSSRIWTEILGDMRVPVNIPHEGKRLPALPLDANLSLVIIKTYVAIYEPDGAAWFLSVMRKNGVAPTSDHYEPLVRYWAGKQRHRMVAKTIWMMEQEGLQLTSPIFRTISSLLENPTVLHMMLAQVKAGEFPWAARDRANQRKRRHTRMPSSTRSQRVVHLSKRDTSGGSSERLAVIDDAARGDQEPVLNNMPGVALDA